MVFHSASSSVAHPIGNITSTDLKDIRRRLNDVEKQIAQVKTRVDLGTESITKLENMLPDHLVVKRDKYGNMVIPDDFWHALQDKIRSDQTIISDRIGSTGTGKGLSVRDVQVIAQKEYENISGKEWDRFLNANSAKMAHQLGEGLDLIYPRIMEKYSVATKSDVLDLIRENWDQNRKQVKLEMNKLVKELENNFRQVQKSEEPARFTKQEIRGMAADIIKNALPHAQLEALVRSNLNQVIDYGLAQVNHFSQGTGAVIDPYYTSPSYVFPSQQAWFGTQFMRSITKNSVPSPKSPETALAKWNEHGDCWCTPMWKSGNSGPMLSVITANYIAPEQVIIEHIPSAASLEPGAAP